MNDDFSDLAWSPDSQWLAYVETSNNTFSQIKVLNVNTGAIQVLTSDRYNSGDPAWSSDGKWLYFLSDRMLKTAVRAPWGSRQPDPFFDRSMKVYETRANARAALSLCARGRTASRQAGKDRGEKTGQG